MALPPNRTVQLATDANGNLVALIDGGSSEDFGIHLPNALTGNLAALPYSASITPDYKSGQFHQINVTNTTAFTINAPLNPPGSRTGALVIEVKNSSGGVMGAITWNPVFVFAGQTWVNPANGKSRHAKFEWNGSKWVCTSFTGADY